MLFLPKARENFPIALFVTPAVKDPSPLEVFREPTEAA